IQDGFGFGQELIYTVSDGTVSETRTITIGADEPALMFAATEPIGVGTDLFELDKIGHWESIDVNPGPNNSYAGENGGFFEFAHDLYFMAAGPQPDDPSQVVDGLFKMNPTGVVTAVSDGVDGLG